MQNNFNVPAPAMLEGARTMRAFFLDDQIQFVGLDIEFADPYPTAWEVSIQISEGFETAETRLDLQKQETEDVVEAMQQAAAVYNFSKYFIEKAFAKKPNVQNAFGLNNYSGSGNTQQQMAVFLANLYNKCNSAEYKPDLLAVGMTQLQIDSIQDVLNSFITENTEQNKFIQGSAQATESRTNQYNDTYGYMQQVNRASKVIFYNNPVKLNQYKLPHGSQGQDYSIEGKVRDGSNANAPLSGVEVQVVELGISDLTNAYGNFGFVGIPAGEYTLQFSLAGYTATSTPVELPKDGKVTANQILTLA